MKARTRFVLGWLLLIGPVATGQGTRYSVQAVPLPVGAWVHGAGAITDGGLVAFEAYAPPPPGGSVSPESRAHVWDGQQLHGLERPVAAAYCSVQRVTSGGRVVGGLRDASFAFYAGCTWDPLGTIRVLRPPKGTRCLAVDRNGRDTVVGSAFFPAQNIVLPVIWQGSLLAVLQPPAPLAQGWIEAVNDAGWMLGNGHTTGDLQPWLKPPSTASVLLGLPAGATQCRLNDLNVEGEAIGTAYFPANAHAVRWKQGSYTDLGFIANSTSTELRRLNRAGTAVGTAAHSNHYRGLLAEGTQLAWLDDRLDPAAADWAIYGGLDIANDGRILAVAIDTTTPGSREQLVVLTPLP